jgi:hypothetical protein
VMGVGSRLSRVAHAAVSLGTRTSSQASHGTSRPVRWLCNINRPNPWSRSAETPLGGAAGARAGAHARSEVPGCMGRKGRLQYVFLVASGGPTRSAATIWCCFSTRPGWRGGHRQEPRAIRDGCGRRRQGVHSRRNVPQGHQFTLRHPSVEDHACKEGP